jgi:hypothetical protein
MSILLTAKFEGKKYMWDGALYDTEEQAYQSSESYQKEGFETKVSKNSEKYLVYSRRVVTVQAVE